MRDGYTRWRREFGAGLCPIRGAHHQQRWDRIQRRTVKKGAMMSEVREKGLVGYPEKRRGREEWKQTSMTEARWPRRTATGSGGGRLVLLLLAIATCRCSRIRELELLFPVYEVPLRKVGNYFFI